MDIIMFTVRKAAVPEVSQYTRGNIGVGAGYSADLQQVTPQRCYNATVSSIGEQQAYIQLANTISFSELEDIIGVSVSASGGFGMFAADAKAKYLRSVEDNDYTMSLNYYELATSNVAVQIAGSGVEALTESGKSFYKDGKNPYFGVLCGDHYIDSFQQGALLTMGVDIKFSNTSEKKEFQQKAGFEFGNIVSAMERTKSVGAEYKMSGSVTIEALQIGGEPSQLSKILNKDSNGNYYALSCSLIAMDDCTKAASGLLNYATENFPNQYSFKDNTGLTPLGIAYSTYRQIAWIGLIPPVSLVTSEVDQYRIDLSNKLKENEYYQEKLYPFLNNGYPTKLEDVFIDNAKAVLSKANSNVRILMRRQEGAADCFNKPDECKTIKAKIDSQLQNITISDLRFLENIKYTMRIPYAMLYNTGSNRTNSWDVVSNDYKISVKLLNIFVIDKLCAFCTRIHATESTKLFFQECFRGNATSNGMEYFGAMCLGPPYEPVGPRNCYNFKLLKQPSPLFFEAYKIIEKDATNTSNPSVHQV